MSISETTIANLSFALIGEDIVGNLSGDSKAVNAFNAIYEQARNEMFTLPENWNFCSTRAELSPYGTAPVTGYDYQYGLPDNCLRIICFTSEDGDTIQYKYRREVYVSGNTQVDVLLTNQDECFIRYIVLRTNPNTWPPWFVKLVYHNVAKLICKPLTKDDQKNNLIARWYEDAYDDAKAANGMEGAEVDDNSVNRVMGNMDVLEAFAGTQPIERIVEQ